jgi:hypothetical protein
LSTPGSGADGGSLKRKWAKRGLAVGVLVAFLSVPAVLLVKNLRSPGQTQQVTGPHLVAPENDGWGQPTELYSPPHSRADVCVSFSVLDVDPAESSVDLGILVDVTRTGIRTLSSYSRAANATVRISSQLGLSEIAIPVPISQLRQGAPTACDQAPDALTLIHHVAFSTRWRIFVLGQPRAFPNDWYQLDDTVEVTAPGHQSPPNLPAAVLMMSHNQDLSIQVDQDKATDPADSVPVLFTVTRQPLTTVYTYWIAALPFVLLGFAFLLGYLRQRSGTSPDPTTIGLGVVATIVAVLPLHAVLVPDSLPTPTRLDLFFGMGITVLVASTVVWLWLRGGHDKPGEPTVNETVTIAAAADAARPSHSPQPADVRQDPEAMDQPAETDSGESPA